MRESLKKALKNRMSIIKQVKYQTLVFMNFHNYETIGKDCTIVIMDIKI